MAQRGVSRWTDSTGSCTTFLPPRAGENPQTFRKEVRRGELDLIKDARQVGAKLEEVVRQHQRIANLSATSDDSSGNRQQRVGCAPVAVAKRAVVKPSVGAAADSSSSSSSDSDSSDSDIDAAPSGPKRRWPWLLRGMLPEIAAAASSDSSSSDDENETHVPRAVPVKAVQKPQAADSSVTAPAAKMRIPQAPKTRLQQP